MADIKIAVYEVFLYGQGSRPYKSNDLNHCDVITLNIIFSMHHVIFCPFLSSVSQVAKMSLAQRVLLTWVFTLVFLITLVLKLDGKVVAFLIINGDISSYSLF